MREVRLWLSGLLLLGLALNGSVVASTLDEVRKHDRLRCGVSTGLPGFSQPDAGGQWSGLDVDFCRAVAAAVLGDANKIDFVPLKPEQRLSALTEGRIDLLSRNTSWTMDRDLLQGVAFVGIIFFDGQGFMVHRNKGVRSTLGLDGVSICVQRGTTSIGNLSNYFTLNRMGYKLLTFDDSQTAVKAYREGRCDALTSDRSQLFSLRSQFSDPADSVVLPEVISKEPLSPAVREGDPQWLNIARWTLFAMINAEEQGIDSQNVERIKEQAQNPAVRHFLGLDGKTGKALGLDGPWVYRVIQQVGNYGEAYDRNFGKASSVRIKRGLNALWRDGGLMYAPPAR